MDIILFNYLCVSSTDSSHAQLHTILASKDVNRNALIMHVLQKTCHKFQTTTKMYLNLHNMKDVLVKKMQTRR